MYHIRTLHKNLQFIEILYRKKNHVMYFAFNFSTKKMIF